MTPGSKRGIGLAAAASLVLLALPLGSTAEGPGDGPPLARHSVDHLEAWKGRHALQAFSEGVLVRTYGIAIGRGGEGPKTYEGDAHTPEGRYTIDARHRSARFHRFLHVSYPNRADRARYGEARRAGRVPEGAGIGGDIGIHGESDQRAVRLLHNRVDWTLGCIAVSDAQIEELYRAVRPGATIVIHP